VGHRTRVRESDSRPSRPPEGGRVGRARTRASRLASASLVLAFVTYGVLHSPLRQAIAAEIGVPTGCYFCSVRVPGWNIAHAVVAVVLIVTALLAAGALASAFRGGDFERLVVFGLCGFGFLTMPAAILGGIASAAGGAYLKPPVGPLVAAVPAALVAGVFLGRGWRPSLPQPLEVPRSLLLAVVAGAGVALTLLRSAQVLLQPPSQGDALSYHAPLAVFYWRDGNLTSMLDRSPGTWAFAHPGTSELWAGVLALLGGERLADLCQLPSAFLGAGAVAVFACRLRLPVGAALLAAASFLLVPVVALQVGTQANDLTGAAFVMAAIALAAAPPQEWSPWRFGVIGLALGLATVTKLATLPTVAVVVLYAAFVLIRSITGSGRRARAATCGALTFALVVAPWWLRNLIREGNPIFPQALPVLGRGVNVGAGVGVDAEFVGRKYFWPVYPLLEAIDDRSGFGALFCIALLPGLVWALARAPRRPLALLLATSAGTLPIWWSYTLHEPRFFLAQVGLGLICVPFALLAANRRHRPWAAALVGVAALLSAALVLNQQIVPMAEQPAERSAFYDRVYALDPVVHDLPEDQGLLQVTGYGLPNADYASTYPLLGPSQQRLLVSLDAADVQGSPEVIVQRMREARLRYAYVNAVPAQRPIVERLFASPHFRVVHTSASTVVGQLGTRRPLYRQVETSAGDEAVRRYLVALVG
jgi:hypothetical protein